jgi:hypothetical protein
MTTTKKISELTLLNPDADLTKTFIPVYDDLTATTRRISLQQINDAVEASIPIAESALAQAITATTNAATADQKGVSAGSFANSAFSRANNSLNVSSGGSITGDLSITGNLTITGCTATLSVSTLRTTDHVLDLGFGTTSTPTQNAGIRVIRGDELPAQIRWNESTNAWQFTNDGTNYINLGESIGIDNAFVNASFQQANTANISAISAFTTVNGVYDFANTIYNSINVHSNGTGTIVTNSIIANSITFGGSLYANAAYEHANASYVSQNTTGVYSNASYSAANVADQRAVTSGTYANAAFNLANTTFNNASTADQKALSAGDYANSGFSVANTANQRSISSEDYANSAFLSSNTADQRALTSGSYANSAYSAANVADQRAVTSGVYANASYSAANTADQRAVTSGDYANSSFVLANSATSGILVTDQKAVSAGSYANSAYLVANVADQRAVTSGVYANAAYGAANTVSNLLSGNNLILTGNLVTNKIIYSSNSSVTQTTSRGNGVVLNKTSGDVVLFDSTMTSNQIDAVAVTNNQVKAGDFIICTVESASVGTYIVGGYSSTDGIMILWIKNITSSTTGSESPTIRFIIIKPSNT